MIDDDNNNSNERIDLQPHISLIHRNALPAHYQHSTANVSTTDVVIPRFPTYFT